jgi:hypothetical protein
MRTGASGASAAGASLFGLVVEGAYFGTARGLSGIVSVTAALPAGRTSPGERAVASKPL